jgi:predicted kinase
VRAPVVANFETLKASSLAKDEVSALAELETWSRDEFQRLTGWFQHRREAGRVRECHGDLHLGNMVLLNDAIEPFDCLEFNPGLRWIDVISEIAFLVMDLQERGRRDLAFRVLNGWLDHSGDYEALTGWRWYFAYRAAVRAKVAALRLQQPDIEVAERTVKREELAKYLDLAAKSIRPRPTGLIVMHGVSGSGKSHVARWIVERFGAVQLRSDAERKRLFGAWGVSSVKPHSDEMYAADVTRSLYQNVLPGLASPTLSAGFPVVIDATCLKRWQRTVFVDLASRLGVNCLIVDLDADPATLKQRLRDRKAAGADPSDADEAVLARQLVEREPLSEDELSRSEKIDTAAPNWQETLEAKVKTLLSAS